MKTLIQRQEDEYWQSVADIKSAAEILRKIDTSKWPVHICNQLEKARIELQYVRNQLLPGGVRCKCGFVGKMDSEWAVCPKCTDIVERSNDELSDGPSKT